MNKPWNNEENKFTFWTIHYIFPDGQKGKQKEIAGQVDTRIKYCEWGQLKVIDVVKERET